MSRNIVTYYGGSHGNADDVKLTDLTFNLDKNDIILSAKFKIEDKHSIRELDIPKIRLRINPDRVYFRSETDPYTNTAEMWIDLGFGTVPVEYTEVDGLKVMYTEKVLEEKYTELTIDEIEKKLGYKVKIVSK